MLRSHRSSLGFLDLCFTSILSVTELWDFPSLTLASPSLLSLLVEYCENGLNPVYAFRFAAITHIYISIFTKRDAQKCERGASVCRPGGYNLCLTGLLLEVQLTGLRAGFCLPSCSSLMPFLCFSSSKGSNSALSYILLKIEDSSLGKVIYVQDIYSWAFVWSPCSLLLCVCLFGLP